MRVVLTVPLLLAAHAVARKSLSIGTQLPHAYYSSESTSYIHDTAIDPSDPYSVASAFLRDVLGSDVSYIIRGDSYTDAVSGITHIYARQLVNGLDVANAHINLNIRDGVILSHGNSFYTGPQLSWPEGASSTFDPYLAYCEGLQKRLNGLLAVQTPHAASQVYLGQQFNKEARVLNKRVETYCAHVHTSSNAFRELGPSAETALLYFIVAATADPSVSESILNNPRQHLQAIQVDALQDTGAYSISGAPGTINDVATRLVYVQVSDDTGDTVLTLAHRFRVDLPLNSYEAYVSVSSPHRILSVVDYASDGDPHTDTIHSSDINSAPSRKFVTQHGDSLAPRRRPIPDVPLPKLAPSTYKVFQWGYNDPSEALKKAGILPGDPSAPPYGEAQSLQKENIDSVAARAGWHTMPKCRVPGVFAQCWKADTPENWWYTTDTTLGNNVFVQEDWSGSGGYSDHKRPVGTLAEGTDGGGRVFEFGYNPVASADDTDTAKREIARSYMGASATQAFYTANMVHDLFYRYGFDEVAGNFQQWNFQVGLEDKGIDNDPVILGVQKGDAYNWGFMNAPEDGLPGRCEVSIFDMSDPYRDSAMSAGLVIHELTHGLTSRLAGGPGVPGCLHLGESKGMSEGWSDYVATTVRATDPRADYVTGDWIMNNTGGARRYPYTLSCTTNPTTYETVTEYTGEDDVDHAVGLVWGNMLWTASAILSDKHGFSTTLFPPAPLPDGSLPSSAFEGPDSFYLPRTTNPSTGKLNPPVPRHGNTLALQIVINGLKLMQCPVPSFLDGRRTILEADQHLTGGANECELWAAFAARGLGDDAKVEQKGPLAGDYERTNGFKVPEKCVEVVKKYGEPCRKA
ncbi:hypothetical protein CONPUDRAFT_170062 [Coniophora puteana RWD-64-598 SS2]|uniref:Extracellular metalloproteinase n=1 Tax=Coniophora puteana (strain RWD-64-598) TaxID=741705 RepID=R7SEX9_CONPW|nr:uncharacterized protein CONPUDRAFT_170062 [Coniophora puteana RWD-64-598 SS2]EIW74726.1 hypothetical protein CONPUDRAFT_170062 [Coniophora puteana RWD-64-598 SS2]